ncbi:2-nitropropane dioxygenase [Aspergillus pseudocaelatus]|uniref:2-nitropropane dioxygenase n=1 Tax=Aspergillus pseudocaelatus TaxID=1825620 RepID=A0ABQ6WRW6_9EURO|nr:2-nitropropane dioxygenase [Aspergillus pseudocaelatus]
MATPQASLKTSATELLGIKHPVVLAGMFAVASPKLAASVTNAGGLGVIGGVLYTPEALREALVELKSHLVDKHAPFGVDLLIPKLGADARKTNYDYSHGKLDELIEIIIESGAKLFVSAVGLPPKHVVDRLHRGGVLYMNMVGHPTHAQKAIDNGADLICAQGGEGGGHTGDIPTVILIPAVAKAIKGQRSTFTGKEIVLIAAGGLYNGQSLAASLMLGASAVWIGTRFILAEESGASAYHQKAVQQTKFGEIIRTTIFSGRPMHTRASPYVRRWEEERRQELLELQSKGIIAVQHDLETKPNDEEVLENAHPVIMGKVAAVVNEILPAKKIVEGMVEEAYQQLALGQTMMSKI